MSNYFEELAKVDCSRNTEKKNGFSYLSWPFAVGELLKRHPDATWRVIEDEHGWPFWQTAVGYFVKVGVTVNGVERVQVHPVLDHRNQPIKEPTSFHVNTSIQRGLVKAIALHGLGLYIYAGEDLPVEHEAPASATPISPTAGVWESLDEAQSDHVNKCAITVREYLEQDDAKGAVEYIERQSLGTEEKTALWTLFNAKERSAMKKAHKEAA